MNEVEVAKVEAYIAEVVAAVEGIGFYPRNLTRYPFDTVATSMMSKSLALARSCIFLLKANQADEAYGLSRSLVEAGLILRYLTSDELLQSSRSAQFLWFSIDYKDLWVYHARKLTAGTPSAGEVERYAKKWNLSGDPAKARTHWSELRGFTWKAQSLVHPLDPPIFDATYKEKEYAVDYFQTCQWVHCSQPALDNYIGDRRAPFKFSESAGTFGNPAHTVLFVLLGYIHIVMRYALYGMKVPVPPTLEPAFSDTLFSMRPIGRAWPVNAPASDGA
jgi:Family of unknown function (DUF5677)